MPSAITMLKADHAKLKRLLRELSETTNRGVKTREELVRQIERNLKTHAQLEEEVFYPAFKAVAEDREEEDLFYEAEEEHHVVDMVLPALKAANPRSNEFKAKAKVLKDLVEHHIREEEGEMFKAAQQLFDADQMRELSELMTSRRETIEAMWESPLTRPVKKLQSAAHKLMPTKVKTLKATAIAKAMQAADSRR